MPNILIVSDTHGNSRFLRRVLVTEKECDIIIHLGDYYEDIEEHPDLTLNKDIYRVPGIMHPNYFSGKYPFYCNLEIEGLKISCVHSLHDQKRIPGKADIILFGHTHKPDLIHKDTTLYVNPGHLKRDEDRGYTASYCLMQITKDQIIINFKDYLCNLQREITL